VISIGLDNPKSGVNVGAALRAANCYGAVMVAVTGNRYTKHGMRTDTTAARRHIPLICVDNLYNAIPYGCVPVAVDLVPDAQNLIHYRHPKQAFYVFGPEDGTLGHKVLDFCRDVVYVPTNGCMNLAATVNVVLYDRIVKESK
jgi:tRNA(Leu) C34 or U34 (ribose-2'-O)-methylase TrmL